MAQTPSKSQPEQPATSPPLTTTSQQQAVIKHAYREAKMAGKMDCEDKWSSSGVQVCQTLACSFFCPHSSLVQPSTFVFALPGIFHSTSISSREFLNNIHPNWSFLSWKPFAHTGTIHLSLLSVVISNSSDDDDNDNDKVLLIDH